MPKLTEEQKKEENRIKAEQEQKKLIPGYYGEYAKFRDASIEEIKAHIDNGEKWVLRLRSPGKQGGRIRVNDVIKGWVEALQLMQEGAKWRLYIPYDMAYGEHGAGEMIPPYSALVFDVELIKVL